MSNFREATSGEKELYGNDRMLEALEESWNGKDLQVLLKDVRNHVDGFVGDEPQFDDLTMLALKINEEDEI
ncbi:MAG: SpoIIE family protein phosphatase [Erysipelotrichaceae bacterium]|nr:SpoIIE family protein phosphatase [Erysipelotrichaceae bacterium]